MVVQLQSPLFQVERQGLAPAIHGNRWFMGAFAAIAIFGTGLPILYPKMGTAEKLTGFSLGFISSVAFSCMAAAGTRSEKINEALDKAQTQALKQDLAAEAQFSYAAQKIHNDVRVLQMLSGLPDQQKMHYIKEFGLAGLVSPPPAPQQVGPGPQPQQPTGQLAEFDLDEWRDENGMIAQSTERLYSHCIGKSMIFAGNPREGKTVAAHYALNQWVKQDPKLVIFAFDKHLGMNNDLKFASNWLGVPQVSEIPQNVKTCVIKADSHQLEKFLKRIEELLKWRVQNSVKSPAVVVAIDEFTNLLESLSEDEVESIVKIFSQIATEAPKYGINFWLILHSLTKEEIGIPRKVLRACHVVMGCEMTQDRIQVSNCPRSLDDQAIKHGQSVYRELGGLPAGFVTSLPVPDGYLPVPSLPNGLADLVVDWSGGESLPEVPEDKPKSPPVTKTEIKSRDINASNAMRDFAKEMKDWYRMQNPKPSDGELRIKWHSLTGKMVESDDAIRYLREVLERK